MRDGDAAAERSLVQPEDEHNRTLVANVHPPDWTNPEPADRYHLVVVGAGTAGLVTAAGAAGLGARVALVERELMGGDCLNVGCVPSKGIIRAARAWHHARTAARFGGPAAAGDGDFAAAMERMRALRAGISHHDSAQRFTELGVDVFLDRRGGQFVASDALEVGGALLRFQKAVIATGARAAVPPIEGLEEAGYLTNQTLFELTELPRRMAIIGAGPIGCEMAQTFARFGSEVVLLDVLPQVLPREDREAAQVVQAALTRDGVRLELGVRIDQVATEGEERLLRFRRGDEDALEELRVDALVLSTGRAPNVEGLGLEAAGVEYTRKGVDVDDRLQTTNPRIFAAGDVASKYQFTHVADALARIAIQNALFFGRAKASDLVVPWCTYTEPEVAHVGLTAEEAAELDVDILTVPLADVDRSKLEGADEGFLRLYLKKGGDTILGATLVAEHAGDMIGELCLAVTHGIGLGRIASVIHPYPTQGEVVKKAADTWRRGKLTPLVQRIFRLRFRLLERFGV